MRYLGGKTKIAKDICKVLFEHYNERLDGFIDLCCGSAKISETFIKMYSDKLPNDFTYFAYDINPYLISLLREVALGTFQYPVSHSISKDDYYRVLSDEHIDDDPALSAFIGFGLSFGGKWKGGPVPLDGKRDYIGETSRTLQKQEPYFRKIIFEVMDYNDLYCTNKLIYVDPPYENTTKYKYNLGFNHDDFWEKIRKLSKNNVVLVSEYNAPDDFNAVWMKTIRTDLHTSKEKEKLRKEHLLLKELIQI